MKELLTTVVTVENCSQCPLFSDTMGRYEDDMECFHPEAKFSFNDLDFSNGTPYFAVPPECPMKKKPILIKLLTKNKE